jgi:hypothetical protein
LLWEIFSYCETDPYPNEKTSQDVKQKVLSGKEPMSAPEGTPVIIAATMKMCFTMVGSKTLIFICLQEPKDRPKFEALLKLLSPNEKPPDAKSPVTAEQ